MSWLIGVVLWFTFDDSLASALGNAGLGDVPLWVVVLAGLALHLVTGADAVERLKGIGRELEKRQVKRA